MSTSKMDLSGKVVVVTGASMGIGEAIAGIFVHQGASVVLLSRDADGLTRFGMPPALARYVVRKGSIAVDGVSLTVVDVGDDEFSVALIPTTLQLTTLGLREPGDVVNLEVDVLAKHVERLLRGVDFTGRHGAAPEASPHGGQ